MRFLIGALGAIVMALAATSFAFVPIGPHGVRLADAAVGAPSPRLLTVAETGIDGENLSATPVSDAIPMGHRQIYTEISWQLDVTAGTTTQIDAECEVSNSSSGPWHKLQYCTDADPAVCSNATLQLGITDQTFVVRPRAPWVRCQFDDAADGTGTLVVTGTLTAP